MEDETEPLEAIRESSIVSEISPSKAMAGVLAAGGRVTLLCRMDT